MRQRLDGGDGLQRQRRGGQQVERSVLPIQGEDAVQRQEAGQKRPDPENPRRDAGQGRGLGADPEGHQDGDDQEEGKAKPEPAAGAEGEPKIS